MKILLHILFVFLIWATNRVNATPLFAKVVLSSYQISFPKIENHKQESEVKIGLQYFARNDLDADQRKFLEEDLGLRNLDELTEYLLRQTPIKESLDILKQNNLLSKVPNVSEVRVASIHRYTRSSLEMK